MPIAAWPAGLPHRPLRSSWSPGKAEGMLAERDMEDGAPLARRKRLAAWTAVEPSIRMSAAQLATFRAFHDVTLNMGADMFDMPVWIGTAAAYQTRRVRCVTWAERPAGPGEVFVALSLKVRDL